MDAWAALSATTIARPDSLVLATTNAGDRRSVLLDQLRGAALSGIDPSICLLEWSAPEDADLWNREAWRYSIPALGYTVTEDKIATMIAATSIADARVEYLCQKVESLNAAVDPQAWAACEDPAGSLINVREQAAAAVDVAPDGKHVTLAAAARTPDDKVRVEIAGAWPSTEQARLELPALLARIKPAAVAWFPSGPAAAIASVLRPPPGRDAPPVERARPGNPAYIELNGTRAASACQEFADLVTARRIIHAGDDILTQHVLQAEKVTSGDAGWRFGRRGGDDQQHVDAAYAAAGAVAAALQLPARVRARLRILDVA
jgi:hypothetical protein